MSRVDNFLNSFKPAVELFIKHVEDGGKIRIVTHNDSDGLSSGGILCVAAARKGAKFRASSEKKLDDKLIHSLAEEKPDLTIFSDLGSGYLDLISKHIKGDVIVMDHHLPQDYEAENIIHLNPMLHGIDGARDIAASGICYLFAKELDEKNLDLSVLGLIGALGDQQDKGEKKTLIGVNSVIEKDAEDQGFLDKHVGLIFYGYETRPIAKAIAYTTLPFIPGLSGDEGSCVAFLRQIGISITNGEKLRALADLSDDEKRTLFSSLSNHMVSQGCDAGVIHQLLGTIYTFRLEEPSTPLRSGREYASLLNACGRMGRQGVGLSICLGDRDEAMEEAQEILNIYRRKIGSALDWVQVNEKVEELENIYVIRAEDQIDDTVIGVVSGILLGQGILKEAKPIIATAYSDDDQIKVSTRSTEELVQRGLHMGVVMQKVAEELEGGGGGHDIAAGAYVPIDKEDEFIARVNSIVPEQYTK
ncbi:MAG: DHH family phosphoesterase [Candidatus Bathyarchaeota archaeon]|nr:DHH family phosphoesterase [Candidatus Bathyarchaeota archaeon]